MQVRVVDPAGGDEAVAELREEAAEIRLVRGGDGSGELFLSPGWVDLHAHVYDGTTSISVHPDVAGLDTGVHLIADAGSAGEGTVDGLERYVLPTAHTAVRAWLNVGSHGLVHLREIASPEFIDVDRTLAAIERHRELVCGVKVRSSGLIAGGMGLAPLDLARLAAREAGLPLMVHIGEAPPLVEDILDRLGEGDVVTHCFHGKTGTPWRADGEPCDALHRALERGVRLDVGHGAASFSYRVAERAIAAGRPPHSISTDLHVRNVGGPVYDLATTMTKLLACGMALRDVIAAVTDGPRATLGAEPWLGADGTVRHATLFRLGEPVPGRSYVDALGEMRPVERAIVPVAAIVAGRVRPCPEPGA